MANDAYDLRRADLEKRGNRWVYDLPVGWDYSDQRAAERALAEGWPNIEPWQRLLTVVERDQYTTDPETNRITVTGKEYYAYHKSGGRVGVGPFATREAAEEAAKSAYESMGKGRGVGELPERPHLDKVERKGPDYRQSKDITGEDYLKDFGFRGVEFGNWVAGDERQKVVNLGYDALHDLARITNLPPSAISLDGDMAVAFGARGHGGRAAAHYEADRRVVNMTKLTGAGSLAHEWMHALDHYLGERSIPNRSHYAGASVFFSGYRDVPVGPHVINRRLPALPPKLRTAANGLMQTLMFKQDRSGHCHVNRKFADQMTMAVTVHAATVAWRHVSIA